MRLAIALLTLASLGTVFAAPAPAGGKDDTKKEGKKKKGKKKSEDKK